MFYSLDCCKNGLEDVPKAILLTHLSGARGGNATVNILLGKKNPSGKLNETYSNDLEDYPAMKFYPGDRNHLEYRESIYVDIDILILPRKKLNILLDLDFHIQLLNIVIWK